MKQKTYRFMPAIPKEHTEKKSTLDTILCLVKNNPNDQDLGRKVRKLITKRQEELLSYMDNAITEVKKQKNSLDKGYKEIKKAIKKSRKQ